MQGSPQVQTGPNDGDPRSPSLLQWDSNYPDPDHEQAVSGLLRLNAEAAEASSSLPIEAISPPIDTPYPQPGILEQLESDTQSALTPPDAAFSRWFNLLASDLTLEKAGGTRLWTSLTGVPETSAPETSAADEIELSRFPGSSHQTPADGILIQDASLLASPAQNASASFPSRATYTKPPEQESWKGSQPEKLSDLEHDLFENFVNELSAWVSLASKFWSAPRLTIAIQIDLYDPARYFSTLVPHLAVST